METYPLLETGVDDGIFPTYAETPAASATALMRVKDFMLEMVF
jgi:hypothetical protein